MEEKRLKEILLKESDEFKKAYQEHQVYEKELEKLAQKDFLTPQEELKEKELKKKKLVLKDKMYILMSRYNKSHPSS
ncbi:MAG: DUF465 domain-containing protein [Acidobacteriota bacterium]